MKKTDSNIDSLELAKQIVTAGLKGRKTKIYLFGSRASGKPWRGSDIDIAVLPLEPFPHGLLSQIREALEESSITCKVDLVDLSRAEHALRERIEREGTLWSA